MFEKEAEEYARQNNPAEYGVKATHFTVLNSFKDGAEFGYNKGFEFGVKSNEKVNQIVDNEWHYVKDEKPKDNEYVLIYTDLKNTYVARIPTEKDYFVTRRGGFVQMSAVIAWKEIVLPKESE